MALVPEVLLDDLRKELLDLSTRNRLLSIPVDSKSARIVQVHDELSEQVFRRLVSEKKAFSFLPASREVKATALAIRTNQNIDNDFDSTEFGLPLPDDDGDQATGVVKRHTDSFLQTALSPDGLQKRLLGLFRDAETSIEEQGLNILYLALGQLKWFEAEHSDTPRYAPLILIPVQLIRKTASERFNLRWNEESVEENLSLQRILEAEFNISLPTFPEKEDDDEFLPEEYFQAVTQSIQHRANMGWEVQPNAIVLGFFSFAKLRMYRDLDPSNWPNRESLLKHPFIAGLLQDGFPAGEPLFPEDEHLDRVIPAARLDHVVDADGSQTLAIEAVRRGRSIVIQGPPGTGKSQSIANIVAAAVLDGKRVLFVAEKLAALKVVKGRLDKEALGAMCLELHSRNTNKLAVIEELGRTWHLHRPQSSILEAMIKSLEERRAILNRHAVILHERHSPSTLSAFMVIGRLTKLGERGREADDLSFPNAEAWTPHEQQLRCEKVKMLADRIERIGVPTQHPWRGVCRETILKIDLAPIEKCIRLLVEKLASLKEASRALAAALGQPIPVTFAEAERQRRIAASISKAPSMDKQAICNDVWDTSLDELEALLEEGKKLREAQATVAKPASDTIWSEDFSDARAFFSVYGRSFQRFITLEFWRHRAKFRRALGDKFPKAYSERLAIVDRIVAGQSALRLLKKFDGLALSAFGSIWHRENSDWRKLEDCVEWVKRQREAGFGIQVRRLAAKIEDPERILEMAERHSLSLSAAYSEAQGLFVDLKFDGRFAFDASDLSRVSLEMLTARCTLWLERLDDLLHWNGYYINALDARKLSLGPLVDRLETGIAVHPAAVDCFERVYCGQLLRVLMEKRPELARFDGTQHDAHVAEFKKLDTERIGLSKHRVRTAHFERMPPKSAGIGPAGIVQAALQRKRGHPSVRKLLKNAGSVVQAIKPVFMMSPLSVAQYLEPGAVEFDLLVIDEASQVEPVDALGAISRCKQIVVVGDSKQLPPTDFFKTMSSSADDSAEQQDGTVAPAKDLESILGLCCARGLPQPMLRWHYRSRHHSLIAISNQKIYENRLFIVPSPFESGSSDVGVKFHRVDGSYDRGNARNNPIEAQAVCRAIIEHARNFPEQTLGVAAFSIQQKDAILNELEWLRKDNPDIEEFFSSEKSEPFFVKNLENVQGDERDVIFISVGYGKDSSGYMAMNFGPLNGENGERRLNVLITRAKMRCEVFSSISAADIDLERASGKGVAMFKAFLEYAETGRLDIPKQTGLDEQSPFEESVKAALESLGHEVHTQVGVAGFFIDLAVRDKGQPGRFLLGIECDGAAYHSSRSARDRDRLRQYVLEDHGWTIHRIWSTDWFQHPGEQLRRVGAAIERAKRTPSPKCDEPKTTVQSEPTVIETQENSIGETDTTDYGLGRLTQPYAEASFAVPNSRDPHDLSTNELAGVILQIVQREGPVHEDEIVARVRDLWGLGRAGSRMQDAVTRGVRALVTTHRCTREEGFIGIPGKGVVIRTRENVASASLRQPNRLPPIEIQSAILALLNANHGASRRDIQTALARVFGFKSTSGQLRAVIDAQASKLLRTGKIKETDGLLKA